MLKSLIPPAGPIRTLCLSHVSKTAANGILLSVAVLYFTRTVDIAADQVGLAMSIGAAIGLFAAVPAGRLSDRYGPRDVTVGLLLLLGVFVCGYPLVGDFVGLLVVSSLVLAVETATDASSNHLIAGLLPPEERVRASSYLRAAANLSIVAGAGAGAVGLYLDTRGAYLTLLFIAGGLFALSGLAYLNVPRVAPSEHEGDGPVWTVLRDGPYAVVALLNTILITNAGVLVVALPIWISEHTSAPPWLFPLIVILNAASVVLLQVRMSDGASDVPGGARALRTSGFLLAACCGLFALSAGLPTWATVALLIAGALVHVLGEMLHATGAWALGFGLAPEHAQGQYQGLFAMSSQLGQVITPVLVAVLLTRWGAAGWLVFAVLFAAAGAVAPSVTDWARRTRAAAPDPVRP
ncbi:MFS transporter [Actinokineospora sp. NBRC 105648]|uniref:MFS transporter n=1 Tax=Actinokineospora sp. NBRC 105648 TaxID=3032206 RepID=UPI0024A4A519|nr:MFS transporter [Actinokineospora sp. NBRC 105648]GLZ39693.1 MFS transporter [Actinokineospora sp. NBRC 105648]